jgi:O-antigen/teichoic acid export membrane protein
VRLARHTLYNLSGLGLPLLAALVSIPLLIDRLGEARFGLLALVWAIVSYFGLFDLGLGRSLTRQLALALSAENDGGAARLFTTATAMMLVLGLLAAVVMATLAMPGIDRVRAVPDRSEAVAAVGAMACALPFVILTSAFRGVLEARGWFGWVNLIRLPMGLFTFLGPLVVVLSGSTRLDVIAWVLAGGRALACAAHAIVAVRAMPSAARDYVFDRSLLRPLCVQGGWMTVSNLVSPFMGYVDRFVVGAMVSAVAVTYYVTPLEIVTKLWIIPGALTAVLFPMFAVAAQRGDRHDPVFDRSVSSIFWILLPVTFALSAFSHELLHLWVGLAIADASAPMLQIFCVGILVNCLAHVPLTWLQGSGASRHAALAHVAQVPIFLALLMALTSAHGVAGAALAWLCRMLIDAAAMFFVCFRVQGRRFRFAELARRGSVLAFAVLMLVVGGHTGIEARVIALASVALISAAALKRQWPRSRF